MAEYTVTPATPMTRADALEDQYGDGFFGEVAYSESETDQPIDGCAVFGIGQRLFGLEAAFVDQAI